MYKIIVANHYNEHRHNVAYQNSVNSCAACVKLKQPVLPSSGGTAAGQTAVSTALVTSHFRDKRLKVDSAAPVRRRRGTPS